MRPALLRYSNTTFEPGARLVLTHGLLVSPRSTAFLARRPAPIITDGFEVLVQLVMAAITTAPLPNSTGCPSISVLAGFLVASLNALEKFFFTPPSSTRSC